MQKISCYLYRMKTRTKCLKSLLQGKLEPSVPRFRFEPLNQTSTGSHEPGPNRPATGSTLKRIQPKAGPVWFLTIENQSRRFRF